MIKQHKQEYDMKQFKCIKAILIAALTLLLAVTLFACNGDPTQNNDNNSNITEPEELSAAMAYLVENSRADIDAAYNWFLTLEEEGVDRGFYISYNNVDERRYIMASVGTPEGSCSLIFFVDNAAAQAYKEQNMFEGTVDGNKLIDNSAAYQNILSGSRPEQITKFTREQLQFMEGKLHRGAGQDETYTVATFYLNRLEFRSSSLIYEGIAKYTEEDKAELASAKRLIDVNYSEDSYINEDEETGIVEYRLKCKIGWKLKEIRDSGQEYAGKYEAYYVYPSNNNTATTVTLSDKIGDFEIVSAFADFVLENDTLDTMIIEKPIEEVQLYGRIKHIFIPLSEVAFVEINMNPALETINFGGTTQQWEALYGQYADYWVHADYEDINGGGRKDITFTVICTNGEIVYPA